MKLKEILRDFALGVQIDFDIQSPEKLCQTRLKHTISQIRKELDSRLNQRKGYGFDTGIDDAIGIVKSFCEEE